MALDPSALPKPKSTLETNLRRWAAGLARPLIVTTSKLLTGVRAMGHDSAGVEGFSADQTVYFANHTSHGDFVLLWATLPHDLRALTRPVAGEDYWDQSGLRRFVGRDVFNALMIRRNGQTEGPDPLAQISAGLMAGNSLIIFPEGTRNISEDALLPFKSGLYHLSQSFTDVRFVPVWIDNLKRVLPKGALLPVPLACTVHFGQPFKLTAGESKDAFLVRARQALLDLRPAHDRQGTQESRPPPVTKLTSSSQFGENQ